MSYIRIGLVSQSRHVALVEIIDKLNREINAGLSDPMITARLAEQGWTLALSPAEFRKLIADETEKWAQVIKFAGIKPE